MKNIIKDIERSKGTIGVVLAGGRSSRMGEDKALLKIEATSMIDRTANTLRATSVCKVVISRNDNTTKHMADIIPDKGPLSGIHSIATRFPQYNLIVLPVDLPLMDACTVQELIDVGLKTSKNAKFKGHNLPLFIQNTPSFRQVIDYTLKCTNCFSVERLCLHFPVLELINKKNSSMFNTNTPAQWRFAMQHFDIGTSFGKKESISESFK
jgi:molybdopterin-guanine dinucleotide biosynthesis protein A